MTQESESDSGHVLLLDCTLSLVLHGFGLVQFLPCYGKCVCPLYTIVHLLLEQSRISLKSSFSTQSVCHPSPRVTVGVGVQDFLGPESGVLNFKPHSSQNPPKNDSVSLLCGMPEFCLMVQVFSYFDNWL